VSAPIVLSGVTVVRDGEAVLRDVSMRLDAGERLAIVGPNGAGKTTLLRTIVGLQRIEAGRVRLFGADCTDERAFRAARPRIGFLFQDSDDQLFCPTVIEDVAFGPLNTGCSRAEAMDRASAALAGLDIAHLADRVAHRLSGGEKRLVCLAGLLAMRPEVLLLDEPTNGVDGRSLERLRRLLDEFAGAIVLVSHDGAFVAEHAARALYLDQGHLAEAEIHTHAHSHAHIHPVGVGHPPSVGDPA
jgi:cobalt/nickel transport system ATP-binding protein